MPRRGMPSTVQAAFAGAAGGFLLSIVIWLTQQTPVEDMLFKILLLTMAGSWAGILLVWIGNRLLPSTYDHKHKL